MLSLTDLNLKITSDINALSPTSSIELFERDHIRSVSYTSHLITIHILYCIASSCGYLLTILYDKVAYLKIIWINSLFFFCYNTFYSLCLDVHIHKE